MVIRKSEFSSIEAKKLRAITSGKYLGIKSSSREIEMSEKELKRRGLFKPRSNKKRKSLDGLDLLDVFIWVVLLVLVFFYLVFRN